ncbi:MAG TPA: GGDEF domain-containing protein [Noviherbaspirillum sp.]|nr:GGDEF domain-containing protein [Noviherbaspirillum sp.]
MAQLDPRSLIFVAGLLGLLCSAILFMLRRSFPPTIGGLVYWSRGLLSMVVASLLFGLTDFIPPFFSAVLANALLVSGIMSFYIGFRHFFGMPLHLGWLVRVLILVIGYIAWYTYVEDNYPARALLITATTSMLFFACTALVGKKSGGTLAGRFTSVIFAGIGIISTGRVLTLILQFDATSKLLSPTLSQKIYLAAIAFAVLAITLGAMMMANERLRTALEFIASHDHLTQAFARGAFIELLTKELARSRRNRRPLALLMFDLDNFKSINDRHGHAVGDRVLIDFVRRTRKLLRQQDSLGRHGGEEFVAMLPETTLEEAKAVAERICSGIAEGSDEDLPRYTVSIGVALATNDEAPVDALMSDADRMLYRAKGNGRNRVEWPRQTESIVPGITA